MAIVECELPNEGEASRLLARRQGLDSKPGLDIQPIVV
jgi:hypothetical protein